MAVPSISTYIISNGSHRYGSTGGAAVMTSPSDSVTKVSAIISQTSGGAAIETVETTVKTSSDQFADRWSLSWPTTGITSSPYYVKMWATNADGNGPTREAAPYIYFPPTVAITAPANGSTLASASVTVAWTASDPYGISAQRVAVLHGADVLLDEAVGESDTSYAVPSSVAFLDGEPYTFRVTARNGNGMEASADSTVAFSFDAPAAASVTITDDGATATIAVDDPHYSESGATIAVDGSAIADSFTVFGNSTQDGTPTPGAPVPIQSVEGRNLLDQSTYATGVYSINTDGSIHVAGADDRAWTSWTSNTVELDDTDHVFYWTSDVPVYVQIGTTYVMSSINGATSGFVIASRSTGLMVKILAPSGKSYPFDAKLSLTEYPVRYPLAFGSEIQQIVTGTNVLPNGSDFAFTNAAHEVAVTRTDGVYTFDGTSQSTGGRLDAIYRIASFRLPAGTYRAAALYSGAGKVAMFVHRASKTNSSATILCTVEMNADGLHVLPSFTVDEGDIIFIGFNISSSSTAYDCTVKPIIVRGSDAPTEYEPYQGTVTPIDLQGHALRSLPDGTRDELRVGERVVLIKRCAETLQAVTDGVTGTVGVDVLSSTGQIENDAQVVYKLAAPQEIDLGAVSDMPFIPEDGEMWVDGTTMEASLRPADYAGQPPISSVDIARVNPDGTWTLAQGVTEGQSAIDPLPPLGVPYRYALTSHAAGGGTKVAYAEHTVETRAWHLNFGDAAQEHVSYLYNPQATMTLAQGGESYHFADGGAGRGLPVFYPTTDRDMSGTLRFDTVLYGDSDILLDLCDRYPVAWLRDPFGHRWRAHVRPSVSHGTGQVWPVTIAWDAVRFEEV